MKILLKKESSTMYSSIKLLKWINEDFFYLHIDILTVVYCI